MFNDIARELNDSARYKGFYDDFEDTYAVIEDGNDKALLKYVINQEVNTKLLLVITELSEIVEAIRAGSGYRDLHVQEEFADVFIRLLDLCGFLGIDLDTAIAEKRNINNDRPYKHNKAF
jgi:NTP pyrophosphatase (non-canonical NTP hydrolase)